MALNYSLIGAKSIAHYKSVVYKLNIVKFCITAIAATRLSEENIMIRSYISKY